MGQNVYFKEREEQVHIEDLDGKELMSLLI
jgi:hypothetical protein